MPPTSLTTRKSIEGLIPDGAAPFKGETSKDVTVTFEVPGLYAVKCLPHYTMGMVALVEVGDDTHNLTALEAAKLPKMVAKRLAPAFKIFWRPNNGFRTAPRQAYQRALAGADRVSDPAHRRPVHVRSQVRPSSGCPILMAF